MIAIRLHAPGGLEGLAVDEVETPEPGPEDVLVRVHAAALTRDELSWPTDRLPAVPSYEMSGVVAETGEPVYALTGFDRDGAASEYALVRAAFLAPKPESLSHVESAAIPLAGLSAWQGLFDHGRLEPGERVLIHGATGGVGHFAVQLARWKGAHVIGTVSGDADAARELGVDDVVDRTATRFEEAVEPVDLVFDTVGGETLERSPAVLREGGRLVTVAEEPPAGTGTFFIVEPNREQLLELARLADEGALRPAIDSVYPLAEARAAFERLAEPGKHGKVVLDVAG
jgi:NADPH:quinone reductase-like Zn-dependent oxidoreductase